MGVRDLARLTFQIRTKGKVDLTYIRQQINALSPEIMPAVIDAVTHIIASPRSQAVVYPLGQNPGE